MMNDDRTHAIAISVGAWATMETTAQGYDSSITVVGDGGIDFYLDAFRAALVASGFAVGVAARLQLVEAEE